MKVHKIAVIAGDGIGPEVIAEGIKVLEAAARKDGSFAFEFEHFPWGCEYCLKTGRMMPADALETLKGLDEHLEGQSLNYSMVFWDQVFNELKAEYPDVETHSLLVDAASMFMVKDPKRFQVVVASNLFGDILTDLGGTATTAQVGDEVAKEVLA